MLYIGLTYTSIYKLNIFYYFKWMFFS